MDKMRFEQGFTILEVLFAMLIFSFGILAVASMQITSFSGNDRANIGSEATAIASAKIDELLSVTYDITTPPLQDRTLDGVGGLADEDAAADYTEVPPGTLGNFTTFWNVANNSPNAQMSQISVIVRWTGGDGLQHRVVLGTTKVSGAIQ